MSDYTCDMEEVRLVVELIRRKTKISLESVYSLSI